MNVRHFLTLWDLSPAELGSLIDRAIELKAWLARGQRTDYFPNRVMAMVFEKSSTRTRVSFETAMAQFGGAALFLSPRDTQLGRGEPIEDTARVLSRMVDIIMVRTYEHEKIERFAGSSRVPVINGLTDMYHPCQLLADLQTFQEHRGRIAGKSAAWIGDGNNMCHSYINAACQADFELRIASPPGYEPDSSIMKRAGKYARLVDQPREAVAGVDLVVTDTWASMGQEQEADLRAETFRDYQVSEELMQYAKPDALFMHCLPAHRGEEVSASLLDAQCSVVWDEAENRLHAQKALIEFLLQQSS